MKNFLLLILFCAYFLSTCAQQPNDVPLTPEEIELLASTKQINQFFRRFNNEESLSGERYYEGNPEYRNNNFRKQYLNILFDERSALVSEALKTKFIDDITSNTNSQYLEFHGGKWFAELSSTFRWKGTRTEVILFMEIQEEPVGSKWVIKKAYCQKFESMFFNTDTTGIPQLFIHPMSHELGFMNLRRAMEKPQLVEYYSAKNYVPDHLSLLLFEIKNGNMKFETVNATDFHFFQIEGWYFKIEYFNRTGQNSGWLISNIMETDGIAEESILKFIYKY